MESLLVSSPLEDTHLLYIFLSHFQDFPSGPVFKTLPSSSGGAGANPGGGAEMPPALQPKTNQRNVTKPKQNCNKFNKDLKNGPH